MTGLTRRQFGAGAAATATLPLLPPSAIARIPALVTDLTPELRDAARILADEYQLFLAAERNYDNSDHELCGPYAWRQRYEALFGAHEDLREEITDDTPAARALLDWANTLFPCPGRAARAFWTPVRDLSHEYKLLQAHMYAMRKRSAQTHYVFWTRFPNMEIGKGDTLETFQAMLKDMNDASHEWLGVCRVLSEKWAVTAGDRQLVRRVIRSHETLDVPYLQSTVSYWKPFHEWPPLPRCPLACAVCDGLRLPIETGGA